MDFDELEDHKSLEQLEIENWQMIELKGSDKIIAYIEHRSRDRDTDGFMFKYLEFGHSNEDFSVIYYKVIFEGEANFDGVRHLNFTPNEKEGFIGYINYPNLIYIIKALKTIDDLVIEKCPYIKNERDKNMKEETSQKCPDCPIAVFQPNAKGEEPKYLYKLCDKCKEERKKFMRHGADE